MPRHPADGALPSRDAILAFVRAQSTPQGKREIARAFGLHGADKAALKGLLNEMQGDGTLDLGPGRNLHAGGGLPKVTVVRVVETDGDRVFAVPDRWDADGQPPRVRIVERGRGSALGLGDRVLARIEEHSRADGTVSWRAHPMKRLARASETLLGVLRREGAGMVLAAVDKRARGEPPPVSDAGEAQAGELVLAEAVGRPPRQSVRVIERLGDPFAPRSLSLIAIRAKGIPEAFPDAAQEQAERASHLPLGEREDLRHLPIVAIDPVDARDHDDAVWAAPDDDPANPGGWRAVVAIADVSWYVRPGTALDHAARERGNSVYFPDRVVPMLPHALSSDACSLKDGVDRAVIACHLTLGPQGGLLKSRFTRAVIRSQATFAYEHAQACIDGTAEHPLTEVALRPLWAAWGALSRARAKRGPLDLDLPERRIELSADGKVVGIKVRERLDAHRLIEDFMIAANVAAAKALESRRTPCMYRDHEPPSREKLVALKDYLETFGIQFALGQVIRPATFNRLLDLTRDRPEKDQIAEQVLRTQTQAYYAPDNMGHFGLALGSYGHFTSPIRRYADLVVHRALVRAYKLGDGGLTDEEAAGMAQTADHISMTERRAMEAERETTDRYVAAYLSERVGQIVEAKISGIARFGLFATVDGIGGDGLLPVSHLGQEYFRHDEAARVLEGVDTGTRYAAGQTLRLRLVEANAITGNLRFALPDAEPGDRRERPRRDRVHRRTAR